MAKSLLVLLVLLASIFGANAQVTQQGGDAECSSPCSRTAVIFVHGLTGSNGTWINPNGSSFPKLLAEDPALTGKLDVYTASYSSHYFSGPPIVAVTKELSDELDTLFKKKRYSKIVFIAHSLGGNITREYFVHVKNTYGHAALSRIRLLITLGTPFNGAPLAGLGVYLSDNKQIRSLIDEKKNDFLQFLRETQTNYLEKRLERLHCNPLEFDAGYEQSPYHGKIIVPKESATVGATRTRGFDKNHIELPKPPDRNDEVYKWVRRDLELCVAGLLCQDSISPTPNCSDPLTDFPVMQ